MAQPLEATQPLLPWRRRPAAQRSEERVARLRWLGAFVGVGALATIALAAAGGATPPDATPRLAAAVAAKTCETSSAVADLEAVCAGTFSPAAPAGPTCERDAVRDNCGGRAERCEAALSRGGAVEALGGHLPELCAAAGAPLDWAPAVDVAPGVTELAWRARSAERGGGAVAIEEHCLDGDSPLLSQTFQKQAYAYWRFALNGDVQTGPSVEATTRVYATRAAFFAALERKRLNAGALVFLDVLYEGLDTAYDRAALADTHVLDHGDLPESACGAKDPATDLDYVCAYQHTPDVLRRSSLLRALFAYETPLVLVLAGDADCRLKDLPTTTHHRLVFPNDGSCATQVDADPARRLWWPEGLEGLDDPARDRGPQHGPRGFAADARALTAAPAAGLEARPFLFDCGLTVTPRKPSRETLVASLKAGGADELQGLARAAGRRARFSSSATGTAPEPTTYGFDTAPAARGGGGAAVFALAPRATWSSGRVVEALLRGAIPVVDATYASDGVSAKGCADAAKFWREGEAGFAERAPFVFVDDWDRLADALRGFGAADDAALQRRLGAVGLPRRLEAHLGGGRRRRRGADTAATTCAAAAFSTRERADLDAAAAAYYSDPAWFASFPDGPAYPGSGCTTKYFTDGRKQHGALCFDAACAPPDVKRFTCGPRAS
ncbi:hypothetical protein JL721_7374 [Aureococcus anophagefferens]|nr:hypothetical protein JL721_7374 [Aureococcus anophagefferens]